MDFTYEENLEDNPFFVKIIERHNALVSEVGSSNWIILVIFYKFNIALVVR